MGFQADGQRYVELQEGTTTPSLLQTIANLAGATVDGLVAQGSVTVSMPLEDLAPHLLNAPPAFEIRTPTSGTHCNTSGVINALLEMQKIYMTQQEQLLGLLVEAANTRDKKDVYVRPEVFDGNSSSATVWLDFYEYACTRNQWTSDEDHIFNMRHFLCGNARKWFDLQIISHANTSWAAWRKSFASAFEMNPVELWNSALIYRQGCTNIREYVLEKWRLLRVADPTLVDSSIVALVMHGMTRYYQRQMQARSIASMDELLLAFKYTTAPEYSTPDKATNISRDDYSVENTSSWKAADNVTQCNHHPSVGLCERCQALTRERCTVEETVFLTKTGILSVPMLVNGRILSVLIDTGASVSLINESLVKASNIVHGKSIRVCGYDGSCREYYRWTEVYLEYEGEKFKVEAMVVPKVNFDFILSRPDMTRMKVNILWNDVVTIGTECGKLHIAHRADRKPSSGDVPLMFPELLCIGSYPEATTVIEVPFLLRDSTTVKRKPYSLSHDKKVWLKQELQGMLEAGIIRPSTSSFASPITIVPKEDGSFRLCTDYRLINKQTDLFPYPMPRIDEIIDETGGCQWFSRIDLCKGYWQVPLKEDTKKFTAFVTPFDIYEYNRLPFGWKNSGAWFQKMMNGVLKNFIGIFCNVYVDDIIVYSRTREDHGEHLEKVLEALSAARLKINIKKSEFFCRKVVFLGRTFDGRTKGTKEESVQRIKKLTKPYDVHSLRVFLGLAGHFRAFIEDYARKTKCLTALTQKGIPFVWSNECEKSYLELVSHLIRPCIDTA